MILSDRHLKELIVNNHIHIVNPCNIEDIQPNSIDLHLDSKLKTIHNKTIDLKGGSYKLKPYEFILGATFEKVNIPLDLVAHIDGKSSIGRLGVFIHVSSGFVDSGFRGNLTLEIFNASDKEFTLVEGMPIAQIVFETLTTEVEHPYGDGSRNNHYQDSEGVVESRYEYE